MRAVRLAATILFATAAAASAQRSASDISLGPLACLPQKGNGVITATISPEIPGSTVRLFFRRMNVEVEDFYYVQMEPVGAGQYWGVFPVPTGDGIQRKELESEGEAPPHPWAAWWKAKEASENRDPNDDLDDQVIQERASQGKKEKRSWMEKLSDADFQRWLEAQSAEPAEFFVAVYDVNGNRAASSEMRVVDVRPECRVSLTPQQQGMANNLTVGETGGWQKGMQPFHWECDGIVTRIDPVRVRRADETCRACIIK